MNHAPPLAHATTNTNTNTETSTSTVFLPLGWWHQVTSLDVSMSLSFTNLDAPNQYTFDNPSLLNY